MATKKAAKKNKKGSKRKSLDKGKKLEAAFAPRMPMKCAAPSN